MRKFGFFLAGIFLAALFLGGITLVGILTPKYYPFEANTHTVCGQPETMRAEGYNILGGTRYGRGPDDPGSDFPLALIDICDPFIETRPDGQERLWFWLEVDVIGQVFPYAAWGLPWEDLARINPADDRNRTDPIWSPQSVWGVAASRGAAYWAGRQASVCDDWDESGLRQFFNGEHGFAIPYGTTQAGWVCLAFQGSETPQTLPNILRVTMRPNRARLTRWVDAVIQTGDDTTIPGQHTADVAITSQRELCDYAESMRPGSIIPGGACEDAQP